MTERVSRRRFLAGSALVALGAGAAPASFLGRVAHAAGSGTRVFVHVFLRGGCDGLSMAVPHGDPDYYTLRGAIALGRPGTSGGVINLDGTFGLHPDLAPLKTIWDEGTLAIVPAAGNYALTRSHFDAQDYMETATPGNKTPTTGWLDRALAQIPGSEIIEAVAFQSQQPRSFLGPEPVLVTQTVSSFDLRASSWRSEAEARVRAMYAGRGDGFARATSETFDAIGVLQGVATAAPAPANGAVYPNSSIGRSLQQAAQIIRADIGTRCIFVSVSGAFDTHSNQLTAHSQEFPRIGSALAAFRTDLGARYDDVVLLMNTEFGRTAAVNGAGGTDHGSAHAMFLMGGPVRGGQIAGGWPGLSASRLYQGRDLAVSVDFRDVMAEIAQRHLGLPNPALLFPDYTAGSLSVIR